MISRNPRAAQLFLASNSPRRRELLALGGWEFDTLSTQVDETPLPDEDGKVYVKRLAKSKVDHAADRVVKAGVIIAADTSVIDNLANGNSTILGKPSDQADAVEMLRSLRSHTHQVHTALVILNNQDRTLWSDFCTTNVTMRNYTDAEITDYVSSGDPMDKAGAYAIQHVGFHPVEWLDGCFANVMGLPLCHLTRSLAQFGITPQADVPQACQAALGYNCPVYHKILIQNLLDY